MTTLRTILTREAERVWKDGKDKNKNNLEHLERKWRNNPRPEVEGLWRRVKIGDFELEDEMAAEENEVPHKDGRQPKFTFSHITRDPNLLNPHLHKNHRYTTPNLHEPIFSQPQIYTTQFYTNPNIHSHKIKPNMRHWVSIALGDNTFLT